MAKALSSVCSAGTVGSTSALRYHYDATAEYVDDRIA
jgi:hypothetical protein